MKLRKWTVSNKKINGGDFDSDKLVQPSRVVTDSLMSCDGRQALHWAEVSVCV